MKLGPVILGSVIFAGLVLSVVFLCEGAMDAGNNAGGADHFFAAACVVWVTVVTFRHGARARRS